MTSDVTAERASFTTRNLRLFGVTLGAAFAIIPGVLIPLIRRQSFPMWAFAIAGVFLLLGVVVPEALRGFHGFWMKLGHQLGAIQSRVLLTIVFFFVVTPLGLLLRIARKVPAIDRDATSYRIPSVARAKQALEKPY
jgi:hypothetical protein